MADYFEDFQTDFNPDEDLLRYGSDFAGSGSAGPTDFGGFNVGSSGGWNVTPELDFIGSLGGASAPWAEQYSPMPTNFMPGFAPEQGGFGATMGNIGQGVGRFFERPDTQKELAKGGLGLLTSGLASMMKRSPSQPSPMAMAGYQNTAASAYQPAPYEAPPGTKASPLITKGPTKVVASQGLDLDAYRKKGGPSGGMVIGV